MSEGGTSDQRGSSSDAAGLPTVLFAVTALLGLLFTQLAAVAALAVGSRVNGGAALVGFGLAATCGGALGLRVLPRRSTALLVPASVVLAAGIIALASDRFLDLSWDGVAYHQEAIIQLRDGWNPLRVHDLPRPAPMGIYATHYPKGPWLVGAAILDLTGRIESAKLASALLIAAAYAATFGALRRIALAPGLAAHAYAAISAANPVALCQTASFLVDGQLASLLTCGAAFGAVAVVRPTATAWIGLVLSATLALTTKSSAAVFVPTLLLLVWAVSLRRRRHLCRPLLVATLGTGCLALILGFNPYVTNLLRDGHPLYPVFGAGRIDIVGPQLPDDLRRLGALGRLATSLLAASDNPTPGRGSVRLKVPFTVERSELGAFYSGDPRVGGFGPLFSGALALSLLLFVNSWVGAQPGRGLTALLLSGIAVSAIAIGPSWWARYVPAVWLVPIVVALHASGRTSGRVRRGLARATVTVLVLNALLVSYSYAAINWTESRLQHARLTRLAASGPVEVSFDMFPALRRRLREAGVRAVEVSTPRCAQPDTVTVPGAAICRPKRG